MSLLFIAGALLSVIAVAAMAFLLYIGYFQSLQVTRTQTISGHCVFVYYQGDYHRIYLTFQQFLGQVGHFFTKYPGTENIGIYYDNPKMVADVTKCRGIVGIIIPPNYSETEIRQAIKAMGFEYRFLPPAQAVRTQFPHLTKLSFILMIEKAYNALFEHLTQNKLVRGDEKFVGLEIYHWGGEGKQRSEVLALYGEDKKAWEFSIHPEPALRRNKCD